MRGVLISASLAALVTAAPAIAAAQEISGLRQTVTIEDPFEGARDRLHRLHSPAPARSLMQPPGSVLQMKQPASASIRPR